MPTWWLYIAFILLSFIYLNKTIKMNKIKKEIEVLDDENNKIVLDYIFKMITALMDLIINALFFIMLIIVLMVKIEELI